MGFGAERSEDKSAKILNYLHMVGVLSAFHGPLLHPMWHLFSLDCSPGTRHAFRRWMALLREEGYDFEQRNEAGLTPLLSYLSIMLGGGDANLEMFCLLLEFGANAHAISASGENALQITLASSDKQKDIVEENLFLLIQAGIDISYRGGKHGYTPSEYARFYDHRDEWRRALKRNGLSIHDITKTEVSLSQSGAHYGRC